MKHLLGVSGIYPKGIKVPEKLKEVWDEFWVEADANPNKITGKMRQLRENMVKILGLKDNEIQIIPATAGWGHIDSKKCHADLCFLPGALEKIVGEQDKV